MTTSEKNNMLTKKRASDNARQNSFRRWIRDKAVQEKQISLALNNLNGGTGQNKKIIFNSDSEEDLEVKPKKIKKEVTHKKKRNLLLGSSDSEDEEDVEKRFKVKQHFEGEKGKRLLEKCSEMVDERFKLDERFQESDDEEEAHEDGDNEDGELMKSEKERNLDVLEKVLGFQVAKRPPSEFSTHRKTKYVRFDPKSEDAAQFMRKTETEVTEKQRLSTAKKVPETGPTATSQERYFEVQDNLKDVLGTSSEQFSFSQKFKLPSSQNCDLEKNQMPLHTAILDEHINESQELDVPNVNSITPENEEASTSYEETNQRLKSTIPTDESKYSGPRRSTFFFTKDDPRLKEGVEFFRRTESMETLREQWPVIRDVLREIYRKNKRSCLKMPKQRTAATAHKWKKLNKY